MSQNPHDQNPHDESRDTAAVNSPDHLDSEAVSTGEDEACADAALELSSRSAFDSTESAMLAESADVTVLEPWATSATTMSPDVLDEQLLSALAAAAPEVPPLLDALQVQMLTDLHELRAANPVTSGADEVTLRRIRARVMSEAGITTSLVIPAPSGLRVRSGRVLAPLSRLRQGGTSSKRPLLAIAAVAAAVMVGVITRPVTVSNKDDVAAAGPLVQSQLNAPDTSQDLNLREQPNSATSDEPRVSDGDSAVVASSDAARSKMAVRDSCFGDGSADALQCGYQMVNYDSKQSSEPRTAQDEWVGAFAPLSMTVSVEKPIQLRAYVENERFVAEYDTTVHISNSEGLDAAFGGPVVIEQELLVDGAWFACEILDARGEQWLTSLSGSVSDLTRLHAGETATRSVAARCTWDSQSTPMSEVFPRTLVDMVADGALLFRMP